MLNEKTLIINIDQSFISRHMKTNKNWGFKGVETESKLLTFEIQQACKWLSFKMETFSAY